MALLYLIRHPHTRVDLATPATEWGLSDAGETQAEALLEAPFWPHISAIYPSREPKTIAAAKEAALAFTLSVIPRAALGEVDRTAYVPPDEATYQATVTAFFAQPGHSPHGWEPARTALERIKAEIARLNALHGPDESFAIVSHGLVLTLLMADLRGEPPTPDLWRAIGFATVAAVDRATNAPLTGFLPAPYSGLPIP
ncbi:MAG: histidine phosphatase family protein [Anaerolineae bacterium]|nr:histidine phosphatase family protein [Anaerolineae bacterium]